MKQKLLSIVGPTAVGKTALSIELAKRYQGEVISGDSMQVYRTLDIGTAKVMPCLLYTSPSPRDQRGSRMPSSA